MSNIDRLKKLSAELEARIKTLKDEKGEFEGRKDVLEEEMNKLDEKKRMFQEALEEIKDNIELLGTRPLPEYQSPDYVLFEKRIPMKKTELITETNFKSALKRLTEWNDDQLEDPNFLKKIVWHVFNPRGSLSILPQTSDIENDVEKEVYILKEMKDGEPPKYSFLSTEESINEQTIYVPTVPMISLYLLKPSSLGLKNTRVNSIFLCLLLGRPYISDEVYENFTSLKELFTNGLFNRRVGNITKEELIKHSDLFKLELGVHHKLKLLTESYKLLFYEYVSINSRIVLDTIHGKIEYMTLPSRYAYHNILCIHRNHYDDDDFYALVPYDISNYGYANKRFFNNKLDVRNMVGRLKKSPPVRRGGEYFLNITLRDRIIFKKKFIENESDFYGKYIVPPAAPPTVPPAAPSASPIVPSKKVIFSKHYPCVEISQDELSQLLETNIIWWHTYSRISKELTSYLVFTEEQEKTMYLEDVYIVKKMIGNKPSLIYMKPNMTLETGKPLLPHLPMISLYLLDPGTLGLVGETFVPFFTALFLCFILGKKYISYKSKYSILYKQFEEILNLDYSTITEDVLKRELHSTYENFMKNIDILNKSMRDGKTIIYIYKTIDGEIVCDQIMGDFVEHKRAYPDSYKNVLCLHEKGDNMFDALVPYDEDNCSPNINRLFFNNNLDKKEIVYNLNEDELSLSITSEEMKHSNEQFIEKLPNFLEAVDGPQKTFLESHFKSA